MPFRLPPDLAFDPKRGFRIFDGVVAPDWTDRNGHMNVVYYRKAFDQATQAMLAGIGLWDEDDRSTFALEDHVTYQRELHPGQPFFVTWQLLDYSDKLIHAFLRLFAVATPGATDAPALAATCEHIGIHVDMRTRRSASIPPDYRALLDEVSRRQATMPRPPEQGRVIGIRRGAPRRSRPNGSRTDPAATRSSEAVSASTAS